MRRGTGLALLLGLALSPSGGHAEDDLARLAPRDTSNRGMHSDFFDDPLGRFMDLLAAGAIAEARHVQPEACARWREDRRGSPLSGRFSVNGTELSLDRICGLEPLRTQ